MIRNLFGGASKCRTIDVCDIFGDNSGKALYRLDGNANDESGNYHGTETAITYGGGVYERGAVFNGSSSVVATTYPQPTGAFTLSAWFKTSLTDTYSILSSSNSGATAGVNFDINSSKVRFGIIGVTPTSLFSTTLVNDNVWRLAIVTWDGTTNPSGIKLYINGVLEGQITAIGTTITASGVPFRIGKYGDASFWFNGSIDQVRIFNRAITATEVATLYAECAPTSTVDNINPFEDGSLKALYQFNGDATDKTGVYNGTATNVTYGTGKFGQCAVFNGSSSKIGLTGLDTLSGTFTFSAYIKRTSTTVGYAILGRGYTSTTNYYGFRIFLADTGVSFIREIGTTTHYNIVAPLIVNDTNFHHYTVTYNSTSGLVIIYQDGILLGSGTSSIGSIAYYPGRDPGLFELGVSNYVIGADNYLNGSIDQFRIFNKALTPMEVAALYNETTPLEEPMHSLVDPFKDSSGKALYRLDGNALDESGNYNGTATSVTYGAGRFGRCAIFSTSKIATTATIGANTSISFWAYRTSTGDSAINGNSGTQYILGNLAVWVSNGSNCFSASTVMLPVTSTWYHIVIVDNGSSVKGYRNGVEITNLTGTYNAITQTLSNIGTYVPLATHNFGGSIDQLRIFNRALTAGEVQTLYTEI